jgi:hypothetical protein
MAEVFNHSDQAAYHIHKGLVDMIRGLVGMIEDLGHNGTPPSWSKMPCSKCERVNEAKRLIGDL